MPFKYLSKKRPENQKGHLKLQNKTFTPICINVTEQKKRSGKNKEWKKRVREVKKKIAKCV